MNMLQALGEQQEKAKEELERLKALEKQGLHLSRYIVNNQLRINRPDTMSSIDVLIDEIERLRSVIRKAKSDMDGGKYTVAKQTLKNGLGGD